MTFQAVTAMLVGDGEGTPTSAMRPLRARRGANLGLEALLQRKPEARVLDERDRRDDSRVAHTHERGKSRA